MSNRREFSQADKVAMVKRSTRNGVVYCEGCGLPTKKWEYDHTIAEAYLLDKTRKLTTADGKLLCCGTPESCHDKKTVTQDQPGIAKAKRREARNLGVTRPKQKIASRPSQRVARPHEGRAPLERRPMFRTIHNPPSGEPSTPEPTATRDHAASRDSAVGPDAPLAPLPDLSGASGAFSKRVALGD